MKQLFTALALVASGLVFGQDCGKDVPQNFGTNEQDCRENVSIYSEFLKQKNYKEARAPWLYAQSVCPQYKWNLYDNGTYIFRKLAAEKNDQQQANIDTLFWIYDQWVANYGECPEIDIKKARDLIKFRPKEVDAAYALYDASLEKVKKPRSSDVSRFVQLGYKKLRNKSIDCAQMMALYDRLNKFSDAQIAAGGKKYDAAKANVEKFCEPCMTCEVVVPIFKGKWEADKGNVDLMKELLGKMEKRKCTDDALYLEIVKHLHGIEPSYESAFGLGNNEISAKNYSGAADYFKQALDLAGEDKEKQVACHSKLAAIAIARKNTSAAFGHAKHLEACEKNKINAQAFGIMAVDCGSNNAERSICYSLALDYADKACGTVPSGSVSFWKGRLQTKSDLFMAGLEAGKEYAIKCGSGEKTILRAKQ